jgi:hypothetical protein
LSQDPSDVYYPVLTSALSKKNLLTEFPLALVARCLVDKEFYANYTGILARYGFVVVVPNRLHTTPGLKSALFPNTALIRVPIGFNPKQQFLKESSKGILLPLS